MAAEQSSITRYGRPSDDTLAWYTVRIEGCVLSCAIRLASAWNICLTWLVTTSASITLTATCLRGMFCSYKKTSAKPPEPRTRTYEKPGRFGGWDGKRRAIGSLPFVDETRFAG